MAHGDRSVDVFVRKLRQKLEKHSSDWRYIHTHFGVGYRFDPEPASGAAAQAAPRDREPAEPAEPARSSERDGSEVASELERERLAPI
jgi:DNA-binding winged helix-turn-helix (wHTH) protein